ncbi:MAG: hypothetical protein ACRD4V_08440 [Candidatus Acidiferrales bacterium]
MKILRVCVIFLTGFVAGVVLLHPKAVIAQPAVIHIEAVPMTGSNSGIATARGDILGFSCVPDTTNQSGTPGDGICYIASR